MTELHTYYEQENGSFEDEDGNQYIPGAGWGRPEFIRRKSQTIRTLVNRERTKEAKDKGLVAFKSGSPAQKNWAAKIRMHCFDYAISRGFSADEVSTCINSCKTMLSAQTWIDARDDAADRLLKILEVRRKAEEKRAQVDLLTAEFREMSEGKEKVPYTKIARVFSMSDGVTLLSVDRSASVESAVFVDDDVLRAERALSISINELQKLEKAARDVF